ncbi:MAG: hypothetical protein ACI9U2_005126, partial [Bradymonadia bacterium]
MTALEGRLSRLDLQLESTGSHLTDERLAGVAQGTDPTAAEAAHLAGCDGCTDLLMAVGVGLEGALVDLPGAESWVHAPQAPPTGTSWGSLLGGGALLVSVAALWVALGTGDPVDSPPAPTRVVEAAEPTSPSSVSAAGSDSARSTHNAPSAVAPLVGAVDDSAVKAAVKAQIEAEIEAGRGAPESTDKAHRP